jgi:hypothetical protein
MFCSKCGRQLRDDEKFCSACGCIVIREDSAPKSAPAPIAPVKKEEKKPKSPIRSLLLKCILGAVGMCALLEVLFIITGEIWDVHAKVLLSIVWIMFYGLIANIAITYYEYTKYKILGLAAVSLIAINFIISTLVTWSVLKLDNVLVIKFVLTFWIIFFGVVHSALLSLIDFRNSISKTIWKITNIAITSTYFIGILMLVFEIFDTAFLRLFLVFIILTLFGSVAIPLINKIAKPTEKSFDEHIQEEAARQEENHNQKSRTWIIVIAIIFIGPSLVTAAFNVINTLSPKETQQTSLDRSGDDNSSGRNEDRVCFGYKVPLLSDMLSSTTDNSYLTTDPQILEKNFSFGLVMKKVRGSDVYIDTTGCKKITGTAFFNNAGTDMQTAELAIRKGDYTGDELVYLYIDNGQSIDFEVNINGVNRIVIQRSSKALSSLDGTKVVVGNIYFE